MCGRFTLRTPAAILAQRLDCEIDADLPPRYNIAPTQDIAVVRRQADEAKRRMAMVRWGLIPAWAKDASLGNRMINARAETVAEKPAFRTAFRRRRCLVAADGYFEWMKREKTKQPYYIRMQDERPFAFAGLWETWRDRDADETVESCTIITTEANELTRPIHDRMPVILADRDFELWLDPQQQDVEALQPLLRPYPSTGMAADPVDRIVNNPRNDGPACIRIVSELF
jgi:putative SOS response-associated peptidase YedK